MLRVNLSWQQYQWWSSRLMTIASVLMCALTASGATVLWPDWHHPNFVSIGWYGVYQRQPGKWMEFSDPLPGLTNPPCIITRWPAGSAWELPHNYLVDGCSPLPCQVPVGAPAGAACQRPIATTPTASEVEEFHKIFQRLSPREVRDVDYHVFVYFSDLFSTPSFWLVFAMYSLFGTFLVSIPYAIALAGAKEAFDHFHAELAALPPDATLFARCNAFLMMIRAPAFASLGTVFDPLSLLKHWQRHSP